MDVYRIDAWKSILQGKNEFFPKVYSNAVVKPLLYMCLSVKEKMSEHDERESFFFFFYFKHTERFHPRGQ